MSGQSTSEPEGLYRGHDGVYKTLLSFGIEPEIAEQYSDFSDSMRSAIGWYPVRGSRSPAVILFLPCNGGFGAHVYLLRSIDGALKQTAHESGDCRYRDEVSIDIAPLFRGQNDAVLLHYACDSHGSGYVEHHLFIFQIVNSRLIQRYETVEHIYTYSDIGGAEENHWFLPIPIKDHRYALEETVETVDLGEYGEEKSLTRKVRRRIIRWSEAQKKFVHTPYQTVHADPS